VNSICDLISTSIAPEPLSEKLHDDLRKYFPKKIHEE